MGLESFGKKTKNAIRAAVLGGSVIAAGAADAGPRTPPSLEQLKQMQAADLAAIEASKNALNDKVARDLKTIDENTKALNEKVSRDLKTIDENTKAHIESPEGHEEMRQLLKQYGLPEEDQ